MKIQVENNRKALIAEANINFSKGQASLYEALTLDQIEYICVNSESEWRAINTMYLEIDNIMNWVKS